MDLGTAGEKLRLEKYRYVEEALDDIQLIWDNCKTYNHPETVKPGLFSGSTKQPKIYKEPSKKWSKTIFLAYLSLYQAVYCLVL